ncbi:hypothetical protein I317_00340 [Kwoniella heveanensis CBS 569]|nr:hypothetical protein I317_00340 [Kwoniella heveanensis CBS 569]
MSVLSSADDWEVVALRNCLDLSVEVALEDVDFGAIARHGDGDQKRAARTGALSMNSMDGKSVLYGSIYQNVRAPENRITCSTGYSQQWYLSQHCPDPSVSVYVVGHASPHLYDR